MEEKSLKNKTVNGTIWSGIDNIAQFSVSFIVGIILARILSPDDYGLLGIIAIFTSICNQLINGGFTNALIRKVEVSDDDYNTVFIMNILMSILLYSIVFLCSPLIASFFNRQELIPLTRVTCLGLLIGALALVPQTRLTKSIDFKSQTKVTIAASLISGTIGIALAVLDFGVWALVAQQISGLSIRTLLMWFIGKWRPVLKFSRNSFNDLFNFGWKIMLSDLLYSIWRELYQVVVGRFYSPYSLGQYSRAKQFSTLFSSNLTSVIERVSFPVLSNIQEDKQRLSFAYRQIIKTTMFITAIPMFFIGGISEPLLYCLIGPQWHDAAVYLPLICISGSTYPLQSLNLNMLQVQGRSDLYLCIEIVKKIIGIFPLFIGAFVGILPMLYTNLITCILCFLINSYYSGKLLSYSSWQQMKDISISYIFAFFVMLSVYFIKYLPISLFIVLAIQIMVGVSILFFLCYFIKPEEYYNVKELLIPYLKRIR